MTNPIKASCLLAAGRGKRAGGPKAWLLEDGAPLLERQIRFLEFALPEALIVASIQTEWEKRCLRLSPKTRWVAVDPDCPVFASVVSVLREIPLSFDGWISLHHVDMPVWEPQLFSAAAAQLPQTSQDALVLEFEGKGGHPVFLRSRLARELIKMDPGSARLDRVLRERGALRLPVPFACCVENWNGSAA